MLFVLNPILSSFFFTHVQSTILVDSTCHARITDFGLALITQNLDFIRSGSGDQGFTARWTAPEILNEEGTYSKEADVFSFAMVMIEVRHRSSCAELLLIVVSYKRSYLLARFRSVMAHLLWPC